MKCSCGHSHKTYEDQKRSHHLEKQRNEYIRYALARFIHWQHCIIENPNDPFIKNQMRLHLDYSERLLGKDNYGVKEME